MTEVDTEHTPIESFNDRLPDWVAPSAGFVGMTLLTVGAFGASPYALLIGGWMLMVAFVL